MWWRSPWRINLRLDDTGMKCIGAMEWSWSGYRRSSSDTRKRQRKPTVSPEVTAIPKPEEKRPKTSKKGIPKLETRKPERPKRVRSESVLIKPVEGVSYAVTLKTLESRVNPEELWVMISGVRETRSKDLLVEVKCAVNDRGRLDSAFLT